VVAAEAFGNEGAWVRDVGQARVNGEGPRIVDEVVDGLRVQLGAAGRGGGCVGLGGCKKTCGDLIGRRTLVQGSVEWGEEVVDVAVE
jgi:hypothetical protein